MRRKNLRPKTGAMQKLKEKLPALLVLAVVVGGAVVVISKFSSRSGSAAMVEVKLTKLSEVGRAGAKAFADNCAQCHGVNAGGGQAGPPLIHNTYNPGHHGDGAFILAMQRGARQHHWRFGDLPPQRQIGNIEAKAIIRYIRELQAANGIGRRLR